MVLDALIFVLAILLQRCCDTLVAKRKVLSIAVQDCVAGQL